jgi:DNA-binding NarL/FixJ family response regulator
LDVHLPGISGHEVCLELGRAGECPPVLFVSGERIEPFDRAAGLMLGADDYLVKPFSTEELIARVRGLLRRTVPVPRMLSAKLTARELEVLRLLAGGLGQQEISTQLRISSRTVGTHIEHILMKLGVQSRAQAVALAYREHLLEPNAPESDQSASPPASLPRRMDGERPGPGPARYGLAR